MSYTDEEINVAIASEEIISKTLQNLPNGIYKTAIEEAYGATRKILSDSTTGFVIKHIHSSNIPIKTPAEALIISLYFILVKNKYVNVDYMEEEVIPLNRNYILSDAWNKEKDLFTLYFIHPEIKEAVFLLKSVVMDDTMIVHMRNLNEKDTYNSDLSINNYIKTHSNGSEYSYHIGTLEKKIGKQILSYFYREDSTPTTTTTITEDNSSNAAGKDTDKNKLSGSLRVPLHSNRDPNINPDPGHYEDPLRVHQPAILPSRGFEGDLLPGFYGGGGSQMGPNHPMFQGNTPHNIPGVPGRHGFPPGVPPGARFDPYGPGGPFGTTPGTRRPGFRPNPDHLAPPNPFDNGGGFGFM